ncbi:barstar family protein [Ornithinimicrobium cerasi]|uniref:barstar family protein n=1 Tax=Ornithinimicrobium cerasi TaxID=2248773 RepID=UPI00137B0744|nr:barstar family protein [Ornithinimicrobium cerasi]
MILVPADRLDAVRTHLQDAGYAVASAVTPAAADLRQTQAELARALRLPGVAGSNLDAMADTLRDLPQIWGSDRVALLWEDADRLAAHDGRAWWILGEILDDADDLTVVALGEARLGRPTEEDR